MKEEKKMLERLDKEIELCWEEYKGAPKLSDEEIDRIVKEVRRSVKDDRKVEQ